MRETENKRFAYRVKIGTCRGQMALWGLLLLAATLAGCDISKPELPSFDSRITIPLGTKRLAVSEAVSDDPSWTIAPDGGISFSTGGDPDTLDLGMDLSMDIPAQHLHENIGTFSVQNPAPLTVVKTLPEAWPEAADAAGTQIPVPAFNFSVNTETMSLAGIESCTLSSGILRVDVENGWPVAISATGESDPLNAVILDGETGARLYTIPLGPIAAHAHTSAAISLAGLTLPGVVKVELSGHGDGAANPVPIAGDELMSLTLSFTNLIAYSASAAIEPQTFNLSFVSNMGDGDAITSALIDNGDIELTLHNQLPLSSSLDLVWPHVITPAGTPLAATSNIPANGAANLTIDFAHCRIDNGGTPLSSLTAHVTARISGSDGQPVTLSSTQGLTADLAPGILSFAHISGCFTPTSWSLDPNTQQLTYPDDSEGFDFTRATLSIQLDNSAGLGADLDLEIRGTPSHGDPVSLMVRDRIEPGNDHSNKTTLVLDENNSDIIHFLNSRPRTITMIGTMSLTDGANCGAVSSTDKLVVSWHIEVPLTVTLNGATLSGDPDSLGLAADIRSKIADHAGAAELQAEVLNHIPAGLQLIILAADDPSDLPGHPGLVIGPVPIPSAQINPVTGEVTAGVTSHPVISLTAEEARYFGTPHLHTMFQVVLPSDSGKPIRVLSTDYIDVSGVLRLNLRVDEEL